MKKNIKNGFSLGEMTITVAVVAFLAVILLPMLKGMQPNQEQIMFKKAYSLAERIIYEMINDEDMYPEPNDPAMESYFGNTETVTIKGETYGASTKFCKLFASKLNRASAVSCSVHSFADNLNPTGTLTASDGVVWILPITDFADDTTPYNIYVDVNGDKKPNCDYDKNSCKKPDRFNIKVYQDGRVTVTGTMEKEYLYRTEISRDAKAVTQDAINDGL